MEFEKLIKFLREQAAAVQEKDAKAATAWLEMATSLEKVKTGGDTAKMIEDTVAARITSGDLVPKVKHVEAVAAAEKTGYDKAVKEAQEKADTEKRTAETIASRVKAVAEAGLDPKFVLLKDQTIEQVVASIPATDEGNKRFEDNLEAWKNLSKKTGQAQATATDKSKVAAPPMGGGAPAGDKKKPGYAML